MQPQTEFICSVLQKAPKLVLRQEPIVSSTTIFRSFVYGLSFLLLEVHLPTMLFVSFIDSSGIPSHLQFPLVHARGESGIVFVAPFIGNVLGVLICFSTFMAQYEARKREIQIESSGKLDIEPEARLPGVLLASLLIPRGLFCLTFSAGPQVDYLLPIPSGVPIGMGMTLL